MELVQSNNIKSRVGLLLLFILCLVFFKQSADTLQNIIYLNTIFVLLLFFPKVFLNEHKLYSGINILLIYYFVSYSIGAYTSYTSTYKFIKLFSEDSLSEQLLFVLISSLFLIIGYVVGYRQNFKKIIVNDKKIFDGKILVIVLIISLFGKFLLYKTGQYYHSEKIIETKQSDVQVTGFNQFAILFNWLSVLGIMYSYAAWKLLKKRSYLYWFISFLLIEVVYALPSGSKEKLMIPIIFTILIISFIDKVPVFLILFTTIFLFAFVFPFYEIYRSDENITSGLDYSFNELKDRDSRKNLMNDVSFYFNQRVNYADIQAVIMEKHEIEKKEYLNGQSYSNFLIALVPRFIWPDKPILAEGNEFGKVYGFLGQEDTSTSVGKYLHGEAFMNFGWSSQYIFLFFGFLLAWLKKSLLEANSVGSFFIYSFIIYQIIRYDQFATFFSSLVLSVVFYFVFFQIVSFLSKKQI